MMVLFKDEQVKVMDQFAMKCLCGAGWHDIDMEKPTDDQKQNCTCTKCGLKFVFDGHMTKREQILRFYHDVFIIAIEDSHSVFQVLKYRHYSDSNTKYDKVDKWKEAFAVIKDVEADDPKDYKVTLKTFKKAFDIIRKEDLTKAEAPRHLHKSYYTRFRSAYDTLDAGIIDAYDAMAILQIGIFGEAIYG